MKSNPKCVAALVLGAAFALGGCAGTQVREIGTDNGHSAYELQGTNLAALAAQAERLCPHGHAVLRQWQSGGQLAGVETDSVAANELAWAVSYDVARPQAQMSIVCRG